MKTPFRKQPNSSIYNFLSDYIFYSQKELEKILAEDSDSQLAKICEYIIKAGGKRLRPLLTLLACEAVGGHYKRALPVSVAIELAHTLGIIQDDIFDQATMRRGVKAVHVAWGMPKAILASDYLFLKMVESILKLSNYNENSTELILKILEIVVKAGLEAIEGEYLDLQLSKKDEITIEECILVAEKKTGAFIKAALEAGALIGGATEKEVQVFREYGKNVGIAYQITDDLLGLTGNLSLVGKDIGADLTNKRITVVMAHALQNSTLQDKKEIMEIMELNQQKGKLVKNMVEIFEKTGSINFARKLAFEYAEKAVKYVEVLKPTQAREVLKAIPIIVVKRKW